MMDLFSTLIDTMSSTTCHNNCIHWLPTLHFATYVSVLVSVPDVLSCNPSGFGGLGVARCL
jgi:hypothetical protein